MIYCTGDHPSNTEFPCTLRTIIRIHFTQVAKTKELHKSLVNPMLRWRFSLKLPSKCQWNALHGFTLNERNRKHTPIKRFFWVPTANLRLFECDGGKRSRCGALYRYTSREILNNYTSSCNWHIEIVCASSTELTYNTHIHQVNEFTYVVVSRSYQAARRASSKIAESGSTRVTWKTPHVGRWIVRAFNYAYIF